MNNKVIVGILSLGTVVSIGGRQLFTPLSLTWDERQYLHDDKGGGRWADKDAQTWNFDLWGAGYNRYADTAYSCNGRCACQVPLTTLIFGKSTFTLSEIFADSTVTAEGNPWVTVSQIRPRIEYNEQGAYFGAQWSQDVQLFKRTFRFGIRGNMPVKMIKVARRYDGTDTESEIETKDDAIKYALEQIGGSAITQTFAYRYDLVNALLLNQTTNAPMITYRNNADTANLISIAGVSVGSTPFVLHVKGGTTSGAPSLPLGAMPNPVAATPALAADGSGVGSDARAHFVDPAAYSDLNASSVNQSKLWLVPTFTNGAIPVMQPGAVTAQGRIEEALKTVEDSIVDYMTRKSIDLSTQRNMGAGDLLLQLFMQRNWHNDKIFSEAQFGVIFPTGKKVSAALTPFCMPLGNNGHYEVEAGLDLGWNAARWAGLQAGFSYHWALKGRECVAAPFSGACVKNLGPSVFANTSWNYLLTDINLTLTEPLTHRFGMNMAYEFYYKTCDKICLCGTQAADLEGNTQDLCASNLTWLTKVRASKVKTEVFFNEKTGSIFGGFDYIFAGRNTPKEIGWHLGLMIEF